MDLGLILYALFTLLTTVGVYGVAAHFGGRRLAVVLSSAVLVFFAVLAVALVWIVRSAPGGAGILGG